MKDYRDDYRGRWGWFLAGAVCAFLAWAYSGWGL